jgi:hypothetical protein
VSLRAGRPCHTRSEPHPEVCAADELPRGVQAHEQAEARRERRDDGTWAPGASTAQAKGGRALRGRTVLSSQLGLAKLDGEAGFARYRGSAATFARAECAHLAATVGGGICGPGPSSMVYSAALQLAASRYLSDQAATTGDPALFAQASRLANDSRQNLIAAREVCAREARSRPQESAQDRIARRIEAMRAREAAKGAP